ncbi:hypothetical protein BX661DRAFT_170235 [Kickxella alabastrina]|uniref:uncharacterized protein n=1 Tax=Kickxella alabastrina TaxID=61397 RepID=UPI002220BD8C|nr:uncharacterized protein BX661DRAFT_170235 [Kickxella alabastrina]KAI7831059.1 hypothetical protein BX661DRAFT_170235 [Kickxella alabastrina]
MDETTQEIQQNELAALRAIFMEDFQDVETKTAWNVKPDMAEFVITVRPTEDVIKASVSVGLRVRLPRTYPRTAPQIQLSEGVGLSAAQVQGAQDMARQQAAALVGCEMVYELAVSLSDYITINNSAAQAARPSFHQQMVEREYADRRADLEREEEFKRHEQAMYAEEQEDLHRRIVEELERKHQQVVSDQQRQQQHLSDIADAVHSVAGRWAEGIQLLKFDSLIYVDPQQPMARDGRFSTVALEESVVVDPLCTVFDAYPPTCWAPASTCRTGSQYSASRLHAAGFIHRGVAPANILLTKEARGRFVAKLFNTSYREELIELHRMTPLSNAIGDSVGNDIRVAPEVLDRPDMLGRKNDIWCAGIVGMQMALGVDVMRNVPIGREPHVLHERRDDIAPPLFRVLAMLLTADHRQRPTAMEALSDAFFSEGMGGEPSVQRQALDSASRGLTFEMQRSAARLADDVGDESAAADAAPARRFFSVAQKNIAEAELPQQQTKEIAVADALIRQPIPKRHPAAADFEEIEFLGKGGFGSVVKARNRIDGRYYAIKKIRLDARDTEGNKKIFREVTTLSRLHHENVVRSTGLQTSDDSMAMAMGLAAAANSVSSWSTEDYSGDMSDSDSDSESSSLSSSSGSDSDSESDSDSDSDDSDISDSSGMGAASLGNISEPSSALNTRSCDEDNGDGRPGAVFSAIRFGTMGALSEAEGAGTDKGSVGGNCGGGGGGGGGGGSSGQRSRAVSATALAAINRPVREFVVEFTDTQTDDALRTSDADSFSDSSSSNSSGARLSEALLREQKNPHPKSKSKSKSGSRSGSKSKSQTKPKSETEVKAKSKSKAKGKAKQPHQQLRRIKASGTASQKQKKILYIQMEYCENKTLNDLIREGLDEKETWRMFGQILEGLNHIHQSGVIHRDLKPVNAFLDGAGDIKIGDFGLATSSFAPIDATASRHMSLDRSINGAAGEDGMTADIGTSSYVAPEVTAKSSNGATRYNQKVDMYSLGIIFFEMCYPLLTGMERATVLHNLRKPEIEFPDDFQTDKMQLQYQIIKRLLNHNPRLRPSSAELLESDLLPPKMEDEYIRETIRTIANPSQPYFTKLMDSLFAHQTDKLIDATFDYRSNDMQTEQLNAVFLDRIRELMTRVFRIHAAVELSTPALTPRTELLDMYQKPALYLDPKGNVVQLPYDQTVPFARYVARTKMTEIKRYCFDRYFVANAAGGQPVSHSAASFDAVTNRSAHAVAAAEVISVACEVFDELPAFRGVPTVLMLNHMSILDAILTYCGILHPEWTAAVDRKQGAVSPGDDDGSGVRVEDKQRHVQFVRNVCFCLGGLYKDKPHTIRQRIQVMSLTTGMRLHSQALDRLQIFMEVRGDLNSVQREVLARIGSECGMSGTAYAAKGAEYVQAVIRAFNELRYVEASVRHFGVAIPFVYAPLYNHHYAYYEGGYAFQIMTDRSPGKGRTPQVLAVGGRYDGLLKRFRHLAGNYTLEDDGSKIASDQKINTMAAAAARGKQRGATTTKFVGKPPLTKLGSDKAGGGPEKSSMAFARRTGSVHSTDVWKKMYDKAAGGSSTGSGGWDPSPGSVSIGTNLSTGSAVLGTARDVVCIGVQIQLDLVIQEMAWLFDANFGLWTRKRCDVVVASFGTRPMLRERIALARELWRHGLRTDFLFNDDPEMTMERLRALRADLKTHESRGGAFMGSIGENSGPLMMPKDAAGAVGIGSSGMGAGGSGLGIGIGVGGGNSGSVGSSLGIGGQQQASGAGMQQQFSNINIAAINHPNPPVPSNSSGNGRLELVLVNPQQTSTKNLNRSKHKQKMALTDRAMSSVGRIMGEVKGAPVLVLDLGPELILVDVAYLEVDIAEEAKEIDAVVDSDVVDAVDEEGTLAFQVNKCAL